MGPRLLGGVRPVGVVGNGPPGVPVYRPCGTGVEMQESSRPTALWCGTGKVSHRHQGSQGHRRPPHRNGRGIVPVILFQ